VRFLISRTRDDEDDEDAVSSPAFGNLISKRRVVFALPPEISTALWFPARGDPPSRLPHSMPAMYPRRWGEKVDPSRREEPHPRESRSLYPVYLSAFIRRQCAAHRSRSPPLPLSLPLRPLRVGVETDSDRRSIPVTNNFYANSGSGRPASETRQMSSKMEGGGRRLEHAMGRGVSALRIRNCREDRAIGPLKRARE